MKEALQRLRLSYSQTPLATSQSSGTKCGFITQIDVYRESTKKHEQFFNKLSSTGRLFINETNNLEQSVWFPC